MKSSKHQAPSTKEASSSKLQMLLLSGRPADRILVFFWSLVLEVWSLVVLWRLEPGIWSFIAGVGVCDLGFLWSLVVEVWSLKLHGIWTFARL